MKTSNKLLLALLAIVIVSMFVVNVILKYNMDEKMKTRIQQSTTNTISTTTSESDSILMEKAINNQ